MTEQRALARILPVLALAPPLFGAALVLGRVASIFTGEEPRGDELPIVMSEIRGLADALAVSDVSGWIHGANLGYPAGLFTPVLPTLLAALLSLAGLGVVGATKVCLAAALIALPLTTALGLRLAGISAWRAALGGYGAAMIASIWDFGAGADGAFRAGLFSQTFAVAFLPLACGLGIRAITTGRGAFAAVSAAALVVLCEPIQGISVLIVWAVALAAAPDASGVRNALVLLGGVVMTTAFFWLPALVYASVYGGGPRRAPGAELEIERAVVAFVTGDGVDAGRAPWLTALAAIALTLALVRWRFRQVRDARLGIVAVFGAVLAWTLVAPPGLPDDALAGGRVIVLAQLAVAALAGVALVDVAALVWQTVGAGPLRAVLLVAFSVGLIGIGALIDSGAERTLRRFVGTVEDVPRSGRRDLVPILAAIEEIPPPRGRMAAVGDTGFVARLLPHIVHGATPLWASAGPAVAASPNAWLAHRDDVARFRELYNIRTILTPSGAREQSRTVLASTPVFTLYGVQGGNGAWLPVVPGRVVEGNLRAWRDAVRLWASADEIEQHPLYEANAADLPPAGSMPGRVDVLLTRDGYSEFEASVIVEADGPRMIALKESFSPFWRATVDGVRVRVWRVAPDMPAMLVPPGQHALRFEVVRPFWMWLLLLLSPGLALWASTRVRLRP